MTMKNLFKKIKQVSILILAISFIGCDDDDAVLPKLTAGFTHTINADTGTVTFINTSTNASMYAWDFGDETSSVVLFRLLNKVFFTFNLLLLYHICKKESIRNWKGNRTLANFYFMKYTITSNLNTKKPRWAKASSFLCTKAI